MWKIPHDFLLKERESFGPSFFHKTERLREWYLLFVKICFENAFLSRYDLSSDHFLLLKLVLKILFWVETNYRKQTLSYMSTYTPSLPTLLEKLHWICYYCCRESNYQSSVNEHLFSWGKFWIPYKMTLISFKSSTFIYNCIFHPTS